MEKDTISIFHKEIDLIQDCIKRMSDYSFRIKAWFITTVSAVLALLVEKQVSTILVGLFAVGITTVFWGLDAFFLRTETLYRWKYAWVIKNRPLGNMEFLYDLNPYNTIERIKEEGKSEKVVRYMFTKTLMPLYLPVACIGILIFFFGRIDLVTDFLENFFLNRYYCH